MNDALQRIAAAVTPAVMVSACGLIALGLDNQAGRMTTRMRDLAKEFRTLAKDSPRVAVLRRQVEILARRHGLLTAALFLVYGALLAFVLTSLLYLAQSFFEVHAYVPVVAFTFGVLMLAAMAVCELASLVLSRAAIAIEREEIERG